MKNEIKLVADYFSKDVIVREMHIGNKRGLKPWEKHIVEKYFIKQNASILDIGCGTGREAFALLDYGFKIIGIDISEIEINIAKDEAKEHGQKIAFETTSGLELAYNDNSFDYIIMWAQAFGNVYGYDNKMSLLTECYRTLKPTGYFCFSGHDYDLVKSKYSQYTDGDKFYAYADTDCYWELFTTDELYSLSTDAGFNVIACCRSLELGNDVQHQVLVCVVQK